MGRYAGPSGGVALNPLDLSGTTDGTGYIDLAEQTAIPGNPAAGKVRLYAISNAGFTEVYMKASSGEYWGFSPHQGLRNNASGGEFNLAQAAGVIAAFRLSDGLPKIFPSQAGVGASGAATAPPAQPNKYLQIRDSAGTLLAVPAYNP